MDTLRRYQDIGVSRIIISMDSAGADKIIPELDRWAETIRKFG